MKTLLLTVLLLGASLGVSAESSDQQQQAMLRAFEISCLDCTTLQYGTDPAKLTPHPCQAGTVCGPVGSAFNCIPEDSAEAASCSCDGKENTYIAEPYDPSKYIACLPGDDQSVIKCTEGIFTGDTAEPCGKGPVCDAPYKKGFNALLSETETCRKFFLCDAIPATDKDAIVTTYDCAEGEVYDVLKPGCVDPCSLAPKPFACGAGDSGPFPDPEDCEVFHICFNGIKIGDPVPCPTDQYYSNLAENMKCIDGTEETKPTICITQEENVSPCYEPYQAECALKA